MITVINGKVNDDDKLRVCKQKKQEKKKTTWQENYRMNKYAKKLQNKWKKIITVLFFNFINYNYFPKKQKIR